MNVHYWRKADVAKLEIICEVADELALDLFVNWTGGYRNWSGTSLTPLTRNAQGNPGGGGDPVKANVTVDLNATYDFTTRWLGDDQVTLNVRNLLDRPPPFYLGATGFDNWSASPLDRVITIGLRAKI